MEGALIILGVLVAVGVVLYVTDRLYYRPRAERRAAENAAAAGPAEGDGGDVAEGECCGMHIVCEKESLSPFTTEAEYYDDEELDRFRGRGTDEYTAEESDEFRNILLTMRTDEIAGWVRSLQVRGVTLPSDIRDEVLLIISEERVARRHEGS